MEAHISFQHSLLSKSVCVCGPIQSKNLAVYDQTCIQCKAAKVIYFLRRKKRKLDF